MIEIEIELTSNEKNVTEVFQKLTELHFFHWRLTRFLFLSYMNYFTLCFIKIIC